MFVVAVSVVAGALLTVGVITGLIRSVSAGFVAYPERLGRPGQPLESGPHVRIPRIDRWTLVPTTSQSFRVHHRTPMSAGHYADVMVHVEYRIAEHDRFLMHLGIQGELPHHARDVVASVVAESTVDDLLTKREFVGGALRFALEDRFSTWGLAIDSVALSQVTLPHRVMKLRTEEHLAEQHRQAVLRNAELARDVRAVEAQSEVNDIEQLADALGPLSDETARRVAEERLAQRMFPPPWKGPLPPPR